jgi:glycosyltransferase involved in cell wall biosynthesis
VDKKAVKVSRVRILLDYRPALRQRTGVGEYVHELARALVASPPSSPEEIVLFSSSWKDRLDRDVVPGASTVDRRIPVQLLNFSWHRLGWPSAEAFSGGTLDVAHSFHPLLLPARTAARVVTVHDLDFLDAPERTHAEIRRDYAALAAKHAQRADRVIANSRTTAHDVQQRLGVPESRISVCYPGAPEWTPRMKEPQAGYLLFLGALEPRKNIGVLLDAYERLLAEMPDAPSLVLAGKVGADSKLINARVADRPLAGRVQLPGYVASEQREQLFKGALAFVMPSHTEGFGMPVVEAMTAGVPVIAADRGALPEVAGSAARFFEPDDVDGLTALLKKIILDSGMRATMRESGIEQAGRFSWRSSAAALRDAWTLAVESRRSVRG